MRLSPRLLCWSVVASAVVVHVLGALSDAMVLAGQATAVALAGLAAVVLLGSGRGRLAVAGGIGVLAVDAVLSAQDWGGPQYLSPFYAPLSEPYDQPARVHQGIITLQPYSAGEDLAWLGDSLLAQLTEHWPALLGMLLICGGIVVTLADRPRVNARWPRWVAWAAVVVVAISLLAGFGGRGLAWRLVTLGTLLPTMVVLAAALKVLVVAAGQQWRVGVPAMLGALLLAAAVLGADLPAVGPVRPVVLDGLHLLTSGHAQQVTGVELRAVAVGLNGSPGFVAAPVLALLPVLAVALLVLASTPWSGVPGRRGEGSAGGQGAQPGDRGDRRDHGEGPDRGGE